PILMIVIGLLFIALSSHKIATQPTKTAVPSDNKISLSQLNKIVAASDKPVIIIVSAKWCAICRELEATTFKDRDLLEKFKQVTVINFDITDNGQDSSTFLRQYKLYGPPAIIILDKNKMLQTKISGYISAADLIKRIDMHY
ncbi:MAG TPA: thioredoxin fold domain-containing protein, partial [Aquella sp.]|nr:thioredoxin fold domain-containing protein [Aquella sp.]